MQQLIRVIKTPVTLILLLGIVGFGAVWGYERATAPAPARSTAPCVLTDVGNALKPKNVQVRVLNGGTVGSLAKRTQGYLLAFGFTVIKVNNTNERITDTVIVGNSADDPEVQLLLGYFTHAKTRGDGRADHVVDVLVGDNFGMPKEPTITSVPVTGPVCLPAPLTTTSTTPSASPSKSAR